MKYIYNPYFLGDSVMLEPVARRLGATLVCEHAQLFDEHPSVKACKALPSQEVINMADALGGFDINKVYVHAGLDSPEASRLYLSETEQERVASLKASFAGTRVGLAMYSRELGRCYPYADHLAKALVKRGHAVFAFDTHRRVRHATNVTTKDLRSLMCWLRTCDTVIAVDSGLAHVAAALGVAVIVLGTKACEGLYGVYPNVGVVPSSLDTQGVSPRRVVKCLERKAVRPTFDMSWCTDPRLQLPSVDCIFIEDYLERRAKACVKIMQDLAHKIRFRSMKLLTSKGVESEYTVRIPPLPSIEAYSEFCVKSLNQYSGAGHVLLCQYDGYPVRPEAWDDSFLEYDYIGAPWWWKPNATGGNGGFSLRSKRLIDALARMDTSAIGEVHPEDKFICEDAADVLRKVYEIRFAPVDVAKRFSTEARDYQATGSFGFHSHLTWNLPVSRKVFHHSGDLGDIIYSLPTIRALGGGVLLLSPDLKYHETREIMTPRRFENIKSLLTRQPYLDEVVLGEILHPDTDYDLNIGRKVFVEAGNGASPERQQEILATPLTQVYLNAFDVPREAEREAWLEVDTHVEVPGRPVVINRSQRYHNPDFNWRAIVERYSDRAIFVGLPKEHAAFVEKFGYVPYYPTENLLDVARVIAGCKLFIGNQSCPHAIAEGLKAPVILEVCREVPNCCFKREGSQHIWYPDDPMEHVL